MKINENQLRKMIRKELVKEGFLSPLVQTFKQAAAMPGAAVDMWKSSTKAVKDYPDAYQLHHALHGGTGFGTDEESIKDVIGRRSDDLPGLYDEYEKFKKIFFTIDLSGKKIQANPGDLIQQLRDDGMEEEAQEIEDSVS